MTSNLNKLYFVAPVLYQQQIKFLPLLSLTKVAGEKEKFVKEKEIKFSSLLLLTKAVR